jgi:hypothetical protein
MEHMMVELLEMLKAVRLVHLPADQWAAQMEPLLVAMSVAYLAMM